jgi:DNA end-binding protein Ku
VGGGEARWSAYTGRATMRITWNGSLSFGLVSIPVGLAPATKPAARQSDVSFRMLHRECLTPIRQKRWCPTHDCEVGPDEIVKGWEVAKGQFVVVDEAELEALERHDDSRAIEISRFVPLGSVDPVWLDRSYLLVPGAAAAQRRPYRLLLEAMREAGVGALGRFVRSGRESLCLVRPLGDALALETMFLAEDVHSRAEIDEAMAETTVKEPELELARQLVAGLSGEFEADSLTSDYRRDLRRLLEAKLGGEEIATPEPVAAPAPVVDLMDALKASVKAAKAPDKRSKKKTTAAKTGSTRKRTASKR